MIDQLAALLVDYFAVRTQAPTPEEDKPRLALIAERNVRECQENPIPGWPFKACVTIATNTEIWETGLLEATHAGKKVGPAGERCLFQLHRFVTAVPNAKYRITPEELARSVGTDAESTAMCVRLGMRVMRWHIFRCGLKYEGPGSWFTVAELYAEYHHPSEQCHASISSMSGKRARAYVTLLYKIGKMDPEPEPAPIAQGPQVGPT